MKVKGRTTGAMSTLDGHEIDLIKNLAEWFLETNRLALKEQRSKSCCPSKISGSPRKIHRVHRPFRVRHRASSIKF